MAETTMGSTKKLKKKLNSIKPRFELTLRNSYEEVIWKLIEFLENNRGKRDRVYE